MEKIDSIQLNYKRPWLTSYQKRLLDSPARYTVCEASTKAGKTASHIIWIVEAALQGKPNQNFWWVAPVFSQAKIAYNRLKNQLTNKKVFTENKSELRITLINGANIWFKSADKPNSLYGEDVYAAVFDEFTRAKEEAWVALRSTVTATKAKVKFIGNCRGKKGWYALLAAKAKGYTKEHDIYSLANPEYEYVKITAYDAVEAGILDIAEIEQAKKDLPENVFRELYLAEPSDDGGNPFGLQHIENCVVSGLSDKPSICYGVDLAKSVDYTVIIGLDEDGRVSHFARFQNTWNEVHRYLKKLGAVPMLIDSTGVGDPIVEQAQDYNELAEGYLFSSKSKQQLMEGLAVAIQNKEITYPDNTIRDELDCFEYEYTRTGVKYSAPAGFHDDCVCALALAWRKYTLLGRTPDVVFMPVWGAG